MENKIEKVKFYRSKTCIELSPNSMIEMAHMKSKDENGNTLYDWEHKLATMFSNDELLKIIDMVDKLNKIDKITLTDEEMNKKLEKLKISLPHLKSKMPKTITLRPQCYKGELQLNISISLGEKAPDGFRNISHSLDWHQVKGFKIFCEESFRSNLTKFRDNFSGANDKIKSNFYFKDKTKKTMYLDKILNKDVEVFECKISRITFKDGEMNYLLEEKTS